MKSMILYVDKKSFVHKIDPITKLFYIVFAICLPIILPDIRTSGFCILLSIFILCWAGVLKQSLPIFGIVSSVLVTVIIIQGLVGVNNVTPVFGIGIFVFYKEGLQTGLTIVLRVVNIVASFLILMLTCKPSDLVDSLMRCGLSSKIGYVINSVFQIIPQMMQTVSTISDAQRSRGMETEGSLLTRIRALLPLMGPVVISSLTNTKERAMALEVRAFNAKGPRTFFNEQKVFPPSIAIRCIMALILFGALVWRISG